MAANTKDKGQPRTSSCVVLLRRVEHEGGNDFEVLLAQRSKRLKAFSSLFVFPGGVEDEFDSDLALRIGANKRDASKITAIRELFEEAGVLLAEKPGTPFAHAVTLQDQSVWQKRVHDNAQDFEVLLKTVSSSPALSGLHYWVTFITPLVEKHRYITDFFIAVVDDASISIDGNETVRYIWASPTKALELNEQGKMALLPPQLYCLNTINKFKSANALVKHAMERPDRLPIQPHMIGHSENGEITLVYPGDEKHPQYPGGENDRRRIHATPPMGKGSFRWEINLKEEPTVLNWTPKSPL